MSRWMTMALLGVVGLAGGCVSVTAPDKPIVINLNIKITQDVVYRLDGKAKALIENNTGIF
ncbi:MULTISPECIES: YnbE family lipoprotein [unclassified Sphingomonas]|uniref:YnbE family lipoprotein n=1 Tax=unclassified Sphingomonas TaxID=196159 RepID=UPI000BD08898|nr:MAG: YnbE family lipoprotein [Sphingomonas sp. 12-62-6]OYX37432.1 MAG: YnbE family lipoprotein [Sphingomonas sp. 32-62-10]OYY65417.1 MAG: YnbE family lipoprotein [Sphingomonas sp. 28-62-11]